MNADDVLTNPQISLPNLHALIDEYGALSGYKLNPTKSEALPVNCRHNIIHALGQTFPYTWLLDHLTTSYETLYRANFACLFLEIQKLLDK